jgi:excisionase family DNA binding protein
VDIPQIQKKKSGALIMTPKKMYYTITEFLQLVPCSRQHIYNCIRRGEIPAIRLGGKHLIPAQFVEAITKV